MRFIWKEKKTRFITFACLLHVKFMQTYTCVKEMNLAHFFKKIFYPTYD